MTVVEHLLTRLQPDDPARLTVPELAVAAGVALVIVLLPPLWRVARLGVTLVHELGHAGVGVIVGRRFTGFVLRTDASGHAVTRGRSRGPGLVATTWAGYPMPALVAAGLAVATGRGWAPPLLAVLGLVLVIALVRVRSVLTAVVTLAVLAGVGALWWWAPATLQAQALTALAAVLLIGAWRHVAASWQDRSAGSDARALARLTPIPALVWQLTYVIVCGAATWVVVGAVALWW